LTLGAVITVLLTAILEGKGMTEAQAVAGLVMLLGAVLFVLRPFMPRARVAEAK